jgi:hypothetical protein
LKDAANRPVDTFWLGLQNSDPKTLVTLGRSTENAARLRSCAPHSIPWFQTSSGIHLHLLLVR